MRRTKTTSEAELNAQLIERGCIAYDISSPHMLEKETREWTEIVTKSYNRKHFYKICIITGKSLIEYADRSIYIDDTTLFFGNPHVPYSWQTLTDQVGYCCLFTEEFLKVGERNEGILQSPLFKIGGTPIFRIDDTQKNVITYFLKNMITEQYSNYFHKNDLFRNYIHLVIHEALKMQPSTDYFKPKNGTTRIASLFLDLLERQFPIDSVTKPLMLKNPSDFAESLSVHVNYLNRTVKEITGKTTSQHIAERIAQEGKVLLQHTDWTIAEVGYALGFEYPSHFNSFFKKVTGANPTLIRERK